MHQKIIHWKSISNSFLAVLILFYCISGLAAAPLQANEQNHSVAPMLKKAIPAVVHIQSVQLPTGGENQKPVVGTGSGVIVDAKEGYVLTNWHVIKGADELMVMLDDGRTVPAKVIGGDAPTDVALIQIPANNLQAMNLGDSDKLEVGDFVLAIGNPFGLSQTVTSGIISALGRSELGIEGYEDFIQTDASINPGNSGGALINFKGELIGINTAIFAPNKGSVGIGFAIPINMAKAVMQQLISYGSVRRGVLGMVGQPVTPQLASAFGLKNTQGAIIATVLPESPAMQAGIKPGDVITAINNHEILSAHDLRNRLSLTPIGETLSLTLIREGKAQTLVLTVQDPSHIKTQLSTLHPALQGLELKAVKDIFPGHGEVAGLQVINVIPGTPAHRFGFRPDDVIVSANQKPVTSIAELSAIIKEQNKDQGLLLRVIRGSTASFVVIP